MTWRQTVGAGVAALCAAAAGGALAADPPRAAVRSCKERIEGPIRHARSGRDTVVGPVVFVGLAGYARPAEWRSAVRSRQWLKTIALVPVGVRATLEVPPEQRAWMRLEYEHRGARGVPAVELRACRKRRSPAAQRPLRQRLFPAACPTRSPAPRPGARPR